MSNPTKENTMNLIVQLPDEFSLQAHVRQGISTKQSADDCLYTTFYAYSDEMKSRVLELIARGHHVAVHMTEDEPCDGEWLEPLIHIDTTMRQDMRKVAQKGLR